MLAVKLLVTALGAPPDGSWLDLLARVPPNVADVGAAVLVFEVLRTRRAANRAARSAVLVAASPVLLVASGVHGDPAGVAVALLLLGAHLLVDHDAPLAAGIAVGVAARVDPLVLLAAPVVLALAARPPGDVRARLFHFAGALGAALLAGWVPALAWGWRAREAVPHAGGPGALGPGWLLARPLDQGLPALLLGDRGYACPRERVLEVVDVGAGQPAVPGLPSSSLGALGGGERPVALVSLRLALGLPDRGPEGRILVVATRHGAVGFLVDQVVRVMRYDPPFCRTEPNRFGNGYVTASFQGLGGTWLLIDWDAIRLPAALTTR